MTHFLIEAIITDNTQFKGMLKLGFWSVFLLSAFNVRYGFLAVLIIVICSLFSILLNFLVEYFIPQLKNYSIFLDKLRILSFVALMAGGLTNVTYYVIKACWNWLI